MVAVINERLRRCRHAAPLVAAIYYLPMFHSSSFSFEPLNVLSSFSSAAFIFQSFFCIVDNNKKKKKLSRWINPTAAFTQSTRVAVVIRDSFFFLLLMLLLLFFFILSGEERLVCAAQLAVLTFGRHLHLC